MNDLTPTPPHQPSNGYSAHSNITVELGKALALVAPITMSVEQQELWLRAAADALQDIHGSEVAAVSVELRRTVTRPSQIVPEIARLVAERRARQNSIAQATQPVWGPPIRKPVMDRRGEPMSQEDTDELNTTLEKFNATARYRSDGSRYMIDASG